MTIDSQSRFEIIRQMAVDGTHGEDFNNVAYTALAQTATSANLKAAALILWDEKREPTLTVSFAAEEADKDKLLTLEKDLYDTLRRNRQLSSAYMSFDGQVPLHSFTLPLKYRDQSFGAVIGLQEGTQSIISENVFLEALTALLALNYAAASATKEITIPREALDQERLGGIVETAITVNHEVNNPLTAILGNVQLLLFKRDDLDDELKQKLKVIEESALKIKDITKRLMHITTPKSVEYTKGTTMLDLSDDSEQDGKSGSSV